MKSGFRTQGYHQITECTESYFDRFGDSALGMGWPNVPDAERRFEVMLNVVRPDLHVDSEAPIRILDLGCGAGHLYQYLQHADRRGFSYHGIDLSERFIDAARQRHPEADFQCRDILRDGLDGRRFDYVIINGVFTSKCGMSFEEMWAFVRQLIDAAFQHADMGIAFNAMAKHVDWEREDLFHLPLDVLAAFLCQKLSRHFVIRNDYGLYEFTTYVYQRAAGGRQLNTIRESA